MNPVRPQKIIVTTDFSQGAAEAYPYAVALARRFDSELILLHVVTFYSEHLDPSHYAFLQASYLEAVEKVRRDDLEAIELPGSGGPAGGLHVRREIVNASTVAAGIVEFVEREKPDLVVMSTHGRRPLAQLLLGSVARRVISSERVPVWVVPDHRAARFVGPEGKAQLRRILVPTDFSEESIGAYRLARDLAREYRAQIDLIHVFSYDLPPIADGLAALVRIDHSTRERGRDELIRLREAVEHEGIEVSAILDDGPASKRIAEHAKANDIDVIVLSRRGRDGTRHVIGGVAERLLHDSDRPVLVV